MGQTDKNEQAHAGKRDRSPNYPSLTFTEAKEKTRLIWEKDKKHVVSLDVASKHLGYKQANGASLPMIGAMKRYGLLVAAGTAGVAVSDDAATIFLYGDDAPESREVIKRLAMLPALFREILEKFPDGLPSDMNLRARLQHEWKFASDKAADTFIKSLREAVALAEEHPDGTQSTDNSPRVAGGSRMSREEQPTVNSQRQAINFQTPRTSQGTQLRQWDLGGGTIVSVTIPNKLTKKHIERIKKYVAVLESEASITWDADDDDELSG